MRYAIVLLALFGCKTQAQDLGLGATCIGINTCITDDFTHDDHEVTGECLLDLDGGYCSLSVCTEDIHCPEGSRCVNFGDHEGFCFLACTEADDCNDDRDEDSAATCTSDITFVDADNPLDRESKVCVPPTTGG